MGGGGGSSRLCVDSIISFWVATAFTTTARIKALFRVIVYTRVGNHRPVQVQVIHNSLFPNGEMIIIEEGRHNHILVEVAQEQ